MRAVPLRTEETIVHAVCDCSAYSVHRAMAWRDIEAAAARGAGSGTTDGMWRGTSGDECTRWLLCCDSPPVLVAVYQFLHDLFGTRAMTEGPAG